jgi:phosphoribosyl 1,2-cyclic phosphodiesterase
MDDAPSIPCPAPSGPPAHAPALCVLASGSSGNCSVLVYDSCGQRRVCLIDAGLSPRRTEKMLEALGLTLDHLDAIILTHLDHDHFHSGWVSGLPRGAIIRLHKRHATRARAHGRLPESHDGFEADFDLAPGVRVSAHMASHDELGVASFRFEFLSSGGAATFGFATDLGRVTESLVEHLSEVDVLAIESNYCPRLQQSSMRPWFLKRRIMGGHGHLSNEQTLHAVEAIAPRTHVVFLHLSRECNRPEILRELHAGADYAVTISEQDTPTRWVRIEPPRGLHGIVHTQAQLPLFGPSPAPAAVDGPVPA